MSAAAIMLLATSGAAQNLLARYEFDAGLDAAVTANGGTIAFSPVHTNGPTVIQDSRLCILSHWPSSGGYLEIRIDPGADNLLAIGMIDVDYLGPTAPTINSVRVTSSLDGHTAALFDRLETPGAFLGDFSVSLAGDPRMRELRGPVTFRFEFEREGGWSSNAHYEIDKIDVWGRRKRRPPACVGNGGATLEFVSPAGESIAPGSQVSMVFRGTPGAAHALLLDLDEGVSDLPFLGEVCSALSPAAIVVPGAFGPTGTLITPLRIPADAAIASVEFCGVLLDLPTLDPAAINISNVACLRPGLVCSDEIEGLQMIATVPYTGSLPADVAVRLHDGGLFTRIVGSATAHNVPRSGPFPFSSDGVITIEQVSSFLGEVAVLFSVDARRLAGGVLPAQSHFDVSVGSVSRGATFDTSCVAGFGPGRSQGGFVVTDVADPSSENVFDDGRPARLVLKYTGEGCGAELTSADPSSVTCIGSPLFASTVFIRASNTALPLPLLSPNWFSGRVRLGESFVVDAGGRGRLSNRTYIIIYDPLGLIPTQTLSFDTSGAQPMRLGDRIGSVRLDGFGAENGADLCRDGAAGSITAVQLTYTGADCSATRHRQSGGSVQCSGSVGVAPIVRIRASDSTNPTSTGARVWFDGFVSLHQQFEITALHGGRPSLGGRTVLHVFDASGSALLQQVEFDTSCSEPISLGDRFGSLRLDGISTSEDRNYCALGSLARIRLSYDGAACSRNANAQSSGSVTCTGSAQAAAAVWVRASDSPDPFNTSAALWFDGIVMRDSAFDLDGLAGGRSGFGARTYVHVLDTSRSTALQSVSFDTSCAEPIRLGDRFGSFEVLWAVVQ